MDWTVVISSAVVMAVINITVITHPKLATMLFRSIVVCLLLILLVLAVG